MRGHTAVKKFTTGAVATAIAAAVLAAAVASPASAGTCSQPYCGGVVVNNSTISIGVANCWDTPLGGFDWGAQLDCMWNGWNLYAQNAGIRIGPYGDSSAAYPYYYDVDGFRVFRGCRVWGQWGPWPDARTFAYNRQVYATSLWVRITGRSQAHISGYDC